MSRERVTFRDFMRELWDCCGAIVLLIVFLAGMLAGSYLWEFIHRTFVQ